MRTFVFLLFVGAALATPAPRVGHVVHEKRDAAPPLWTRTRRLEADVVLPMRFGLTQSNTEKLEEMLMDIAHPASPNYGNHYSPEQIAKTFAPSRESIAAVKEWLEGSGFTGRMRLSPSSGWIDVNATAKEAEALLDAEYHVYRHSTGAEHVCESLRL